MILAAVSVCFAPILGNEFVNWDDTFNLVDNPSYRGFSTRHLAWMFTALHLGHYHPLTWLSFALDHLIWGLDPRGYHLTNLLLHVANALLVYALILTIAPRVVRDRGAAASQPRALCAAAVFGALLFAIHPLRVESVAWASERRDVLSGLFYLLTVWTYLRLQAAPSGGRGGWYVASILCLALSLLSKAWAITAPAVLLALDVYPLGRHRVRGERRRALLEKLPYVVLALAASVQAVRAQRIEAMRTLAEHGVVERIMQAAYGLAFYLGKTVVPRDLSPHYLLSRSLNPWEPRYLISLAAVVGCCASAWWLRRRAPGLALAWIVYVIVVSPVLGLVQSGTQLAADRYSYLACLPWAAVAAAAVLRSAVPAHATPAPRRRLRATLVGALAVAGVAALGVLTWRQTFVWRSSRTLWDHVLRLNPRDYIAYSNRGLVSFEAGELQAALADQNAALSLNPGYALAYNNRGIVRQALGDVAGAFSDYDAAVRFRPRYAEAYTNRGTLREATGDMDGALEDYGNAIGFNPEIAKAYYGRANARAARGDVAGAIADYGEAVRIDPGYVEAYNNRALARHGQGDVAGAVADLERARAAAPPGSPQRARVEANLANLTKSLSR